MYTPVVKITLVNQQIYDVSHYIKELSCSENICDGELSFTPGVIQQSFSATFYDKENAFHQLAIDNSIKVFDNAFVSLGAQSNAFSSQIVATGTLTSLISSQEYVLDTYAWIAEGSSVTYISPTAKGNNITFRLRARDTLEIASSLKVAKIVITNTEINVFSLGTDGTYSLEYHILFSDYQNEEYSARIATRCSTKTLCGTALVGSSPSSSNLYISFAFGDYEVSCLGSISSTDLASWYNSFNYKIVNVHAIRSIGNYRCQKFQIKADDSYVEITAVDRTYILDEIIIEHTSVKLRTLKELFDLVFGLALNQETYRYDNAQTESWCASIKIYNSYLLRQTARSALDKICQVGLLNVTYELGVFVVSRCIYASEPYIAPAASRLFLNASIYKKDLKFNITRDHYIDTFRYSQYKVSITSELIKSVSLTSGFLVKGVTKSLPLAASELPTNDNQVYNWGTGSYNAKSNVYYAHAKGYGGLVEGSIQVSSGMLSEPLSSIEITINLQGDTYTHEGSTFDNLPDIVLDTWDPYNTKQTDRYLSFTSAANLSSWIRTNGRIGAGWTSRSRYKNYQEEFLITPFVTQIFPANYQGTEDNPSNVNEITNNANLTGEAYILNKWVAESGNYAHSWATQLGWSASQDASNLLTGSQLTAIFPQGLYDHYLLSATTLDERARLLPVKYSYSYSITKVDDYNYNFNLKVPLMYTYFAKAQESFLRNYVLFENQEYTDVSALAFQDVINSVTIEIRGYRYVGSYTEYAYSLDDSNNLTTSVSDTCVFSINSNDLIRDNLAFQISSQEDSDYLESVVTPVLKKYKNGMYEVDCDVTAYWALDHEVTIGSQCYVKLLNGITINKKVGGRYFNVLFEVKNIQKVFKNASWIYQLKMLEVASLCSFNQTNETISSLSLRVEYWFKYSLTPSVAISRVEVGGNYIVFRRRSKGSLLSVEETYVGRVVINKFVGTLTMYKHVSGTTYTTYKSITLSSYESGTEIWSFELRASTSSSYNLSDFLSQLGGRIVSN